MKSQEKVARLPVERALEALSLGDRARCKKWLLKALGLIEVEPERKCFFTWRKPEKQAPVLSARQ